MPSFLELGMFKNSGADPGFSWRGGGFEQTSAYIILLLLFLNKSFFHKKKYGQIFAFVSL